MPEKKKTVKVKSHYRKTKSGKKIRVKSHRRTIKIRVVTVSQAKKAFEKKSLKKQKSDIKRKSKRTYSRDKIPASYIKKGGTSKADVVGIDDSKRLLKSWKYVETKKKTKKPAAKKKPITKKKSVAKKKAPVKKKTSSPKLTEKEKTQARRLGMTQKAYRERIDKISKSPMGVKAEARGYKFYYKRGGLRYWRDSKGELYSVVTKTQTFRKISPKESSTVRSWHRYGM
jgi:hypothetical protein